MARLGVGGELLVLPLQQAAHEVAAFRRLRPAGLEVGEENPGELSAERPPRDDLEVVAEKVPDLVGPNGFRGIVDVHGRIDEAPALGVPRQRVQDLLHRAQPLGAPGVERWAHVLVHVHRASRFEPARDPREEAVEAGHVMEGGVEERDVVPAPRQNRIVEVPDGVPDTADALLRAFASGVFDGPRGDVERVHLADEADPDGGPLEAAQAAAPGGPPAKGRRRMDPPEPVERPLVRRAGHAPVDRLAADRMRHPVSRIPRGRAVLVPNRTTASDAGDLTIET